MQFQCIRVGIREALGKVLGHKRCNVVMVEYRVNHRVDFLHRFLVGIRLMGLDHVWWIAEGETIKSHSGDRIDKLQLTTLVVGDFKDGIHIELPTSCGPYFVYIGGCSTCASV